MKFEIGIPTLNRADLLNPSLVMYNLDFPSTRIWVLDNGTQNIKPIANRYIISDDGLSVGASWNKLCENIFSDASNDYALILNDDIYLGKKTIDIEKIVNKKNKSSLIRATADWCAFLIPRSLWEKIKFDECFYPAYYEDKSYEYRMKLKGISVITTPELNPFIYQSSKTLEKDPSILQASKKNKQLYIEMWGGEPTKEKYKQPFNKQ
jgi:GT2 family glycosyltransferase